MQEELHEAKRITGEAQRELEVLEEASTKHAERMESDLDWQRTQRELE